MLLAAAIHDMAHYVGIAGAVAIVVLMLVPILFFYGWRATGQKPETGPALKAWLLGRAVAVACGLCLLAAAFALQWLGATALPGSRASSGPFSPLAAWGATLVLFLLGVALVFFGARACGKIYDALCQRREGYRVALYELGIPFGIAVFAQLMNLIVLTVVGPEPSFSDDDDPLAALREVAGGIPQFDPRKIAGGNAFPGDGQGAGLPATPGGAGLAGLGAAGFDVSKVPETLFGKAGYLVYRGFPRDAWEYAWAAYLLEEDAQLKSAVKWCSLSRRPALAMPRLGVGVLPEKGFSLRSSEGRRLMGALAVSMAEVVGALGEVFERLDSKLGNVPWIAYLKEQETLQSLYDAARRANVDAVLVFHVARKRRGSRQELELQAQLFQLGGDQPLWKSRKITSSQYLAMKSRGTDLIREAGLKFAAEFKRLVPLTDRPELDAGDVPSYLKRLLRDGQVPPIEKVAVVKYLAQHGLLSAEKVRQAVRQAAGKQLNATEPNDALQQWVQERLPPIRVQ